MSEPDPTSASGRAAALADVPAEPGAPKPDPILVVDDVHRQFGGLVAVDVDHLEIQRGVVTALIGPNGAGKTTFFNLLTGFDDRDRGTWQFDGVEIQGRPSYQVAQAGMVRTFQLTKVLSRLTVLENMKLGATGQGGESLWRALLRRSWASQEQQIEERAHEELERFDLARMRDEYAATLSGGQRKLLELARALMVQPTLVMLDEPMAGVNPALAQTLLDHMLKLPDRGMTVVFVEHDMDIVMNISDWIVCMAEGRIIAEGPPDRIANNDAVIDAYLGRHHDHPGGAR
ncbi:MAG: ABC transporter ATP-binding protein [Actinomycetota bacterium]|nr:ABC transporter ATP-binding protein [Actinomycetota bacterium]